MSTALHATKAARSSYLIIALIFGAVGFNSSNMECIHVFFCFVFFDRVTNSSFDEEGDSDIILLVN